MVAGVPFFGATFLRAIKKGGNVMELKVALIGVAQ
jgi:hypothetical protein